MGHRWWKVSRKHLMLCFFGEAQASFYWSMHFVVLPDVFNDNLWYDGGRALIPPLPPIWHVTLPSLLIYELCICPQVIVGPLNMGWSAQIRNINHRSLAGFSWDWENPSWGSAETAAGHAFSPGNQVVNSILTLIYGLSDMKVLK